jgi:hypothetical protein
LRWPSDKDRNLPVVVWSSWAAQEGFFIWINFMGNWRTVRIIGTCSKDDVTALRAELDLRTEIENFHCLGNTGGLCSLPNWGNENIDVIGNLAERDYSVNDVAKQLEKLAKIAPSLKVKIHCGGDYESTDCVNTIVLENGVVEIRQPEIESIGEISQSQIEAQFFDILVMSQLKQKGLIK